MPSMITKAELDQIAAGCDRRGCDHTQHTHPLYIHSKCHTACPIMAHAFGNGVVFSCLECWKPVLLLLRAKLTIHLPTETCKYCKLEVGWPTYVFGAGILRLVCYGCDQEYGQIYVQD